MPQSYVSLNLERIPVSERPLSRIGCNLKQTPAQDSHQSGKGSNPRQRRQKRTGTNLEQALVSVRLQSQRCFSHG
uniref:Uncharacterized protein n=1 Tax=Ascaris lumbricoides TaxID=6252 RepID=A0A0M3HPM4_ASCLU